MFMNVKNAIVTGISQWFQQAWASPSCPLHLQQNTTETKVPHSTNAVAIRKLTATIFKPERNETSLGMLSLAYKVWRSFLTTGHRLDRSCFTHGPRYLSAGCLELGVKAGVADSKDCISSNRLVTLLTPEVYHKVMQDLMDSWLRLIDGSLRPWTTYPAVDTSRSR